MRLKKKKTTKKKLEINQQKKKLEITRNKSTNSK